MGRAVLRLDWLEVGDLKGCVWNADLFSTDGVEATPKVL